MKKQEHKPGAGVRSWFLIKLMYVTIIVYVGIVLTLSAFNKVVPDSLTNCFFGTFVIQFLNLARMKMKRRKGGTTDDTINADIANDSGNNDPEQQV